MRGPRSATGRSPQPAGPPVFTPGRLYGVRKWTPRQGEGGVIRLGGCYEHQTWETAGQSTWARCRAGEGHPAGERAPAGGCTCGLYAMHPRAISRQPGWSGKSLTMVTLNGPLEVVGIVEAWGRVQVHREGFRAEHARPVALLLIGPDRASDYGRMLEDIAIAHRAKLLESEGALVLERYCRANRIGISPEAVEALIGERDPGGLRVD